MFMALPAWNCIFNTKKCGFLQLVVTLGCNPGSKSSPLYNQLNCSSIIGPKGKTLICRKSIGDWPFLQKWNSQNPPDFWNYFQHGKVFHTYRFHDFSMAFQEASHVYFENRQFWLLRLWNDEEVPTIGTSSSLLVTTHLIKRCSSVISASFLPQFLGGSKQQSPNKHIWDHDWAHHCWDVTPFPCLQVVSFEARSLATRT